MLDYLRIILAARLDRDEERGASAVEYGLLIAGIAALIVVVVFALGPILARGASPTPATRSTPATPTSPPPADEADTNYTQFGGTMAAAGSRSRHLQSWT